MIPVNSGGVMVRRLCFPYWQGKVSWFEEKQKPKLGCHPLPELSKETYNTKIGKWQIAKIKNSESNIWREYKNAAGHIKRKKIEKYSIINAVLYKWCINCCQAGIYPDGAILQKRLLKLSLNLMTQIWGTLNHLMGG